MREILFRGKTLSNESEWVEGFYNHIPCGRFQRDEHCIQTINEDGRIGQLYNVYENTVGQFTGLTDKNGKKIFEGDLLNGFSYPYYRSEEDTHNYFAEVVWFDGNCAFGLVTHKHPTSTVRGISDGNADFIEGFDTDDWEIIGNIHDNPELLEGA